MVAAIETPPIPELVVRQGITSRRCFVRSSTRRVAVHRRHLLGLGVAPHAIPGNLDVRFRILGAIDFSYQVDAHPHGRIDSSREAVRPRIGADVQLKETMIFDDEADVRDAIAPRRRSCSSR
jgi:hypothetical protein